MNAGDLGGAFMDMLLGDEAYYYEREVVGKDVFLELMPFPHPFVPPSSLEGYYQVFLQQLAAGDYTFSSTFGVSFLQQFSEHILYNVEGLLGGSEEEGCSCPCESEELKEWMMALAACRFLDEPQPKDFYKANGGDVSAEDLLFFATVFVSAATKGGLLGPHGGGLVAHKCRLPLNAASFIIGGIEVRVRGIMKGQLFDAKEGDCKYGNDDNKCKAPPGMEERPYLDPRPSKSCPWIVPYTYFAPIGEVELKGDHKKLLDHAYYQEKGSKALAQIPSPFKPPKKLKGLYQAFLQQLADRNYNFFCRDEHFLESFARHIFLNLDWDSSFHKEVFLSPGAASRWEDWHALQTACEHYFLPFEDLVELTRLTKEDKGAMRAISLGSFAILGDEGIDGLLGDYGGELLAERCQLSPAVASFKVEGSFQEYRIKREEVSRRGKCGYDSRTKKCDPPQGMVEIRFKNPRPSSICPWLAPYSYYAPLRASGKDSDWVGWWGSLGVVGLLVVGLVFVCVKVGKMWARREEDRAQERQEAEVRSREVARELWLEEEEKDKKKRKKRAGGGGAAAGGRGGGGGGGGQGSTPGGNNASVRRRRRRQQHQQQEQQAPEEAQQQFEEEAVAAIVDSGDGEGDGGGGDAVEEAPVLVVPLVEEEEETEEQGQGEEVRQAQEELGENEGGIEEVEAEAAEPEPAAAVGAVEVAVPAKEEEVDEGQEQEQEEEEEDEIECEGGNAEGDVGEDQENEEEEPPKDLCCPISRALLVSPVVAADGETYSLHSITDWIATCQRKGLPFTSPVRGHEMPPSLIPNALVQKLVVAYLEEKEKEKKMKKR